MKSPADAASGRSDVEPIQSRSAGREDTSILARYGLPSVALTAVAATVGAAMSVREPETRHFSAYNQRACDTVPEGIDEAQVASYRASCRSLVGACAEQAEVLQGLSAAMFQGFQGPNAHRVIGLQEEAKQLRAIMDEALGGMDKASGGRKPEKIVCQNTGPNMTYPRVDRTSRKFPQLRKSQNR